MPKEQRDTIRALIGASDDAPRLTIAAGRALLRHSHEPGIVERVARYQRFVAETPPFAWGEADCSLHVADWAVANGFDDPASDLRGAYGTQLACRRLLDRRGGILAVVSDCAARIGLRTVKAPTFGAIAVIGAQDDDWKQWSAIWDGQGWAVKWTDDVVRFAARPLRIWSLV